MHSLIHFSFKKQVLLACTIALSITPYTALASNSTQINDASFSTSTLIALGNTNRLAANLPALQQNKKLERAAQLKAEDMARKGYFSHISPDNKNSWYWFTLAKYYFKNAGENLAVGYNSEEETETGWMKSPSHKANILGRQYKETGIGIAIGIENGKEVVYVVQLFGTQAVKKQSLSLAPKKGNTY